MVVLVGLQGSETTSSHETAFREQQWSTFRAATGPVSLDKLVKALRAAEGKHDESPASHRDPLTSASTYLARLTYNTMHIFQSPRASEGLEPNLCILMGLIKF